jgi:Pentapeptide repeats (8 copies)
MANDENVALLKQGVTAWNEWRLKNPGTHPNLRRADLSGVDLSMAHLRGADLSKANLSGADLTGANLTGANLSGASLIEAALNKADLIGADLTTATLVRARLSATMMTGVYGTSVWDVETDDRTKQTGLIVTPDDQPAIRLTTSRSPNLFICFWIGRKYGTS